MCGICGCGKLESSIKFQPVVEKLRPVLASAHQYQGHVHEPQSNERLIKVEQDLLSKNNIYAAQNRCFFQAHGILALNMVSSPGAGKTALLVETIKRMKERFAIAVIEGDQQTERDADRIRATGVQAMQINTGKLCHLEAKMIGEAIRQFDLAERSLLFIENIGNLVCPSSFDLGERLKVVVLSVTEGDDKPLKYPDMFHAAEVMVINKIDLLPYVDFDVEQCICHARQVKPDIRILQLSATKGDSFSEWADWLAGLLTLPETEKPARTQG